MIEIPVGADGRGCMVRIRPGGLEEMIAKAVRGAGAAGAVALLSDSNVLPLHGETARRGIAAAGACTACVAIEPGEGSKSLDSLGRVAGEMLRAGVDRGSALVALGGGIVGDLGGMAAALYMRGIPLVMAPTSLLAQVDASVGGKSAVNHRDSKNLIGVFRRPAAVVIDTSVLSTLPRIELACGLAEALKHAVLQGPVQVGWMESRAQRLMTSDPETLAELVENSVRFKAAVVEADELDTRGIRARLNLGHTIGHALETLTAGAMRHGEAVSVGIVAACRIAQSKLGFPPGDTRRLSDMLQSFGLPVELPHGVSPERVLAVAGTDKKRSAGEISWVLPSNLGKVEIVRSVPGDMVLAALSVQR